VARLGLLAVAERSYLPHNDPMRSTQSGGSDSPRSRWNDPDKDNFEGTTRHEERWVVRGASPSEVCQRLAACLSTTADGPAVKARKGSRVIYGLTGDQRANGCQFHTESSPAREVLGLLCASRGSSR
jgi:hypothetical protein